MKKILIILWLILCPQLALAQSNRNPCVYITQPNCLAVGYYLAGSTGAPMPVGGIANAAAPTFAEGLPGYLSFDLSGNLRVGATVTPSGTQDVNLKQIGGSTVTAITAGADAASNTSTGLQVYSRLSWFNGTTWDRALGDATNGLFVNVKTSVLPTLAATSTKQSDGSQKSQIVDGSGNVASQTANAIDVNIKSGSSGLPTGAATAANQILTQAPVAPATATATKADLIGAQATSAAVNPTTGQQSALSSDLNNNLLVSTGGAPNLATSQASVTTGNISVSSARALRRSITITNVTGTSAAFCGNTGVTTSTGTYLGATAGSSITLNTTAAVFCTVASVTQTVTVAETF